VTEVNITVSVTSSAGQPPVFLQSHYNAAVYEDAALVSHVLPRW